MKNILSIFLCLVTVSLFGQSKWQLGVSYSSDVVYRTLHADTLAAYVDDFIKLRNADEKVKYGYTTGVNVVYTLKKWQLETGLFYSRKGYIVKRGDLKFGNTIDPRKGFIYPVDNSTSYTFIYRYSYLDIPLKLNYQIGTKRLHYAVSTGIIANIFLSANSKTEIVSDNSIQVREYEYNKSYFNSISLSGQLTAAVLYVLSEKQRLRLEPTFRYMLTKQMQNVKINQRLWSIGLNLSYLRSF